MNDEAVYRTAPATPGLLIISNLIIFIGILHIIKTVLAPLAPPSQEGLVMHENFIASEHNEIVDTLWTLPGSRSSSSQSGALISNPPWTNIELVDPDIQFPYSSLDQHFPGYPWSHLSRKL